MASKESSNQQLALRLPKPDDPTQALRDILAIVDVLDYTLFSENQDDCHRYITPLGWNLRLLKEYVVKLLDLCYTVGDEVGRHIGPLLKLHNKMERGSSTLTKDMKIDLEDINKKILNLMSQVPLVPNKQITYEGLDPGASVGDNNGKCIECLPAIHENHESLKRLEVFRQVRDQFKDLSSTNHRICLLSFAAFPENQEVNRTMLMYWWIGEGILPDYFKPEDVVKAILEDFTKRELIEPVENNSKVEPNSYKMSPFVHSSVVLISKDMGLCNMYHKGKQPSMNLWFSDDQPTKNKTLTRLSKSVYRNLKVFYLGRWERTAKRNIEIENSERMEFLKHMTKLKLLSFQGIINIERLDDAVCKLRELIILDLRAFYNLDKLPEKIDSLKSLIYLDITDCYMIDRMPKRLSWLDKLEVLKGFVVSDATDEEKVCLLSELTHLKKLRKLSITINKGGDFTVDKLFLDIESFGNLEKLKVAWRSINEHKKEENTGGGKLQNLYTPRFATRKEATTKPKQLPINLKKLDLQCFPEAELPEWIQPHKLGVLEKLYIKGGTELTGFGKLDEQSITSTCNVKILRLKYLPRLKVNWMDLQEKYFPKLEFLEKYQCPQVSFCPCDGLGIWRKPKQL